MGWLTDPQMWIAFLTLAALEIVLGIDNIVFISILVDRLPHDQRSGAYRAGLGLAMVMRILLLLSLSWIMGLTEPLFTLPLAGELSGRDLVLVVGGLFLVAKSTHEIHVKLEGAEGEKSARVAASYGAVLAQILALDVVFSLDSVITAVGMVQRVGIMIAAVVAAVVVMMAFARSIGDFVARRPTIKMLALAFLLAIGVMLMADGFGHHVPKGYLYFAMAFALFVEILNLKAGHRAPPVHLRQPYVPVGSDAGPGA
ncbi:MAG TPA: TerC family protein [Vicinamibacteria bacterium]|nr:TerC family protein [Vicinamibacteria bacterium]